MHEIQSNMQVYRHTGKRYRCLSICKIQVLLLFSVTLGISVGLHRKYW
jgi:hypothetical protein